MAIKPTTSTGNANNGAPNTEYFPTLFAKYIEQNLWHLQQEIDQNIFDKELLILAEDLDEKIRHTLNFAIGHHQFWESVKAILLQVMPLLEQSGRWSEWLPYLEQGYEASQACGDRAMCGELAVHIGILNRGLAEYDVAEPWFWKAEQVFEELGDEVNQAKALNRLAYQKRVMGNLAQAERLAQLALEFSFESTAEKGISYNILGAVAYDQRQWESALRFFQYALEIYQKNEERRLIVMAYIDCALAYQGRGDYECAAIRYQLAQDAITLVQAPSAHIHLYLNFGTLNLLRGNYESALAQCIQAEPMLRKVGDVYQLGIVLHNQGFAYSGLKIWELAIQAYTESKACFQKVAHFVHLSDTLCELCQVYLKMDNIRQAEKTLSEAKRILHLIGEQFHNEYYRSQYNTLRIQLNAAKQHQFEHMSEL